jgi:hypothetical protein
MNLLEIKTEYSYEYQRMADDEAKAAQEYHDRRKKPYSRNLTWSAAMALAYERIDEWITTAHEYQVNVTDPLDVARFAASHRRAAVWGGY